MPFVPSPPEVRALRRAVDRAALGEAERVVWLLSLLALLTLDAILVAFGASWVGLVGGLGGAFVLYWRLRGAYLPRDDDGLHGLGLWTRPQRAFTALMLRQSLTGRNPLTERVQHDPLAVWQAKVSPQSDA